MPVDGADVAYKTVKYLRTPLSLNTRPTLPPKLKLLLEKAFPQLFHGDPVADRRLLRSQQNENGPLGTSHRLANNDARPKA